MFEAGALGQLELEAGELGQLELEAGELGKLELEVGELSKVLDVGQPRVLLHAHLVPKK